MDQFLKSSYAEKKSEFVWTKTVHPEDEEIAALNPLPVLTFYECLSTEGDYTLVRRTLLETPFRVLSSSLSPVPMPKFELGQTVLSLVYNPPKPVTVYRIEWHVKHQGEVFYVIRDGKVSRRRYMPDQLESIDDNWRNRIRGHY